MLDRLKIGVAVFILAAICLFHATAVLAGDMQVIESNVDKYPVGTVLPDTAPMGDLPRDGRVRVLLLSPMTTKVFEGNRGERVGPLGGTRSLKPTQPSPKRE